MQRTQPKLFVIVDPTVEQQDALAKAILIAKLGAYKIHAFLCIYEKIEQAESSDSRRGFKHDSLQRASNWLEQQMEPCRASGLSYSTEIVWNSRWVEMAKHAVAKSGCDLVVKSSYDHSKAARFLRKTSDFTLMRYCACPILFTHRQQPWQSDSILACVDLESDDPHHTRLNHVILHQARAFAEIAGLELHLAGAYHERLSDEHLPLETHGKAVDADALAGLYDLPPERILLRQGETVPALLSICESLQPGIVVLGTIARSGLSGKLIGNTAEKLLDQIDADLLTVN